MQTSQKRQTYCIIILLRHTTALKKSKLYNNEQVGKTATIKVSKFYNNNRSAPLLIIEQFKNIETLTLSFRFSLKLMRERSQAKKVKLIWMLSFKQPSFQFISRPSSYCGADDSSQINVTVPGVVKRRFSIQSKKKTTYNSSDNI